MPKMEAHHGSCGRTRREFLWETGAGFTGLALASLLERDGFFTSHARAAQATSSTNELRLLAPKPQHFTAKAKCCIFLFMYGGPSQMDTFDYKPELQQRDGQTVTFEHYEKGQTTGTALGSRRTFRQYGQSGQWCCDALPNIAQQMDKLAVIKSLYCDTSNHGSAMIQMNSGHVIQGHPALGSWMSYGLGTLSDNLPSFVVMLDPRGGPTSGAANWSSGFMPAGYQGTVFRSRGEPILNLNPARGLTTDVQRNQINTINELNAAHLRDRPGYSELAARVASYELAFRLQSAAPEALDLASENERTKAMYGINDPVPDHPFAIGPTAFGRQCLIARRLVERGVRFVQIYSGGAHQQKCWDAHGGMEENLRIHCPEIDRPIAGLLMDLEQRGLLDETLVIWGGEFGRQPTVQTYDVQPGRDHNGKGFTYWLAGGGVKAGTSYGATDELGTVAVKNPHHIRDLHATVLHLMGLDHEKLTYFYGGLDRKLTGVQPARVIEGVVA